MMMGYFGGMFDLGMQRLIEIFSQVPFLFHHHDYFRYGSPSHERHVPDYQPSHHVRVDVHDLPAQNLHHEGKKRATTWRRPACLELPPAVFFFVHILPNLVAILVTLVPFSVSALILALASLDYLGFGLPDTYASWGRLLNDGLADLSASWVVTSAFSALVITLLLVTFIGEAVREAFDPKKFTTYK